MCCHHGRFPFHSRHGVICWPLRCVAFCCCRVHHGYCWFFSSCLLVLLSVWFILVSCFCRNRITCQSRQKRSGLCFHRHMSNDSVSCRDRLCWATYLALRITIVLAKTKRTPKAKLNSLDLAAYGFLHDKNLFLMPSLSKQKSN